MIPLCTNAPTGNALLGSRSCQSTTRLFPGFNAMFTPSWPLVPKLPTVNWLATVGSPQHTQFESPQHVQTQLNVALPSEVSSSPPKVTDVPSLVIMIDGMPLANTCTLDKEVTVTGLSDTTVMVSPVTVGPPLTAISNGPVH